MKGLKRSRDVVDADFDDATAGASEDGGVAVEEKRARIDV